MLYLIFFDIIQNVPFSKKWIFKLKRYKNRFLNFTIEYFGQILCSCIYFLKNNAQRKKQQPK